MTRHTARAGVAGAFVAAVTAAAMQLPASPHLTGDAPPPTSLLSLWYQSLRVRRGNTLRTVESISRGTTLTHRR
jgi:hypothetical protein